MISRSASPIPFSPAMTYGRVQPTGVYAPLPSTTPMPMPMSPSSPNRGDFQIEKATRSRRPSISSPARNEFSIKDNVFQLLSAKDRIFAAHGHIPLDTSQLTLFFRTKSGISHSLDFPIDVAYDAPPALEVLIAACRPHQNTDLDSYGQHESLFFPPNLPLTTSLELGNHPILDALRETLFPLLPAGHYLTAHKDKLEVLSSGARLANQPRSLRNDGRVATIVITLPVRFEGGALIVRDPEHHQERFGGPLEEVLPGHITWSAFLADCDYEVEPVVRGCKMTMSYAVYLKSFGHSGVSAMQLVKPSEDFLGLLAPILNTMRRHKIAFYLSHSYEADPSEVLAESLVPKLKGGDAILYHALKAYKLVPALHWTAGGYIWPADSTVEIHDTVGSHRVSSPGLRGPFNVYGATPESEEIELMRTRVQNSGATSLAVNEITLLTDWNLPPPGKERVAFASSGGDLDRLVVNVLVVAYIV